jgi:hypothetical protein
LSSIFASQKTKAATRLLSDGGPTIKSSEACASNP